MIAANKGNINIVKSLLEKGVDVNAKDSGKWTALIYSTYHNHEKMVKLLLQHNAEQNVRTNKMSSALIFAAQNGNVNILKSLFRIFCIDIDTFFQ
jgi:ankyrin repeat protein